MKALVARRLKYVYAAGLILSFHYAFTIYINSSFLTQYFSTSEVSLLYIYGSILSILGLIASSSIIKRVGNVAFITVGLAFEIFMLLGLYQASDPVWIKAFFIVHQALPTILFFSMDLFVEGAIRGEINTGGIRSLYLTLLNVSFVLSPLITSWIILIFGYRGVYLASAFFCIILVLIVMDFLRTIPTRRLKEINFIDSIRKFLPHKDLDRIFIINFLLQLFFSVMVIYIPLYLYQNIGFGWKTIGLIFTIMLLPFVLFELPLGRLFDRLHTEKDTMIAGFIIMSLSTCSIFFFHSHSIIYWMVTLFCTRVGASFVEVASDYSFFKRVSEQDAGFISLFRMAAPLSYVISPLLVAPLVLILPLQYIFLFLGIVILVGIPFAYKIKLRR